MLVVNIDMFPHTKNVNLENECGKISKGKKPVKSRDFTLISILLSRTFYRDGGIDVSSISWGYRFISMLINDIYRMF